VIPEREATPAEAGVLPLSAREANEPSPTSSVFHAPRVITLSGGSRETAPSRSQGPLVSRYLVASATRHSWSRHRAKRTQFGWRSQRSTIPTEIPRLLPQQRQSSCSWCNWTFPITRVDPPTRTRPDVRWAHPVPAYGGTQRPAPMGRLLLIPTDVVTSHSSDGIAPVGLPKVQSYTNGSRSPPTFPGQGRR
jgi:hypothetical protein